MGKIARLGAFSIIVLLCLNVFAQEIVWHSPSEATVAWDAVTPDVATDVMKYNVYISLTDKADIIKMSASPILATQFTIDFTGQQPNNFLAAVTSVLFAQNVEVGESDLAWSDDPTVCKDSVTFGFIYRFSPVKPEGFFKQ